MAHLRMHVGLLALAWGFAAAASAQPVYRCGNSYSQQPCGSDAPLPLQDARSPDQQAAATSSALRAGKEADRLEAERLARERAAVQRAQPRAAQAQATGKPKKGKATTPQKAVPFTATFSTPKPKKSKSKGKLDVAADGVAAPAKP